MHRISAVLWLSSLTLLACMHPSGSNRPGAATVMVPDHALTKPLVFVAYGDTRFTDPGERRASNPVARRALAAKVAAEEPAAIFMNGDLPWHGVPADYAAYREETARWRDQRLRVYPALGNHEFAGCDPAACLDLWWGEFPALRGLRWYSVSLGHQVFAVALDSNSSLLSGSEQRNWLESQMATLDPGVRLVFVVLHHPPLADVQKEKMADHNPRPNEQALAEYLEEMAPRIRARVVVSAGHIHNYERFERGGVVYLVSGGGGAKPYDVDRTPADRYQSAGFPNFHYVRFELGPNTLVGEMIRLDDSAAPAPVTWKVRDRFELILPP